MLQALPPVSVQRVSEPPVLPAVLLQQEPVLPELSLVSVRQVSEAILLQALPLVLVQRVSEQTPFEPVGQVVVSLEAVLSSEPAELRDL